MEALSDDLLIGGSQIAEFMFADPAAKRRIYNLQHELPLFRIGSIICARKSTLIEHMRNQEAKARAVAKLEVEKAGTEAAATM